MKYALLVLFLFCGIVSASTNSTLVMTLDRVDGRLKARRVELAMNPTNVFSNIGAIHATNLLLEISGSKDRAVIVTNNWTLVSGSQQFDISNQGLRCLAGVRALYTVTLIGNIHYSIGLNQETSMYAATNDVVIYESESPDEIDKGIHSRFSATWIVSLASNDVVQMAFWNRGTTGSNGTGNINLSLPKILVNR